MEKTMLTQSELAERWGVSDQTIDTWVSKKVIKPSSALPGKRFSLRDIELIENENIELEEFTPFERRNLLKRIKELEEINGRLKSAAIDALTSLSRTVGF